MFSLKIKNISFKYFSFLDPHTQFANLLKQNLYVYFIPQINFFGLKYSFKVKIYYGISQSLKLT